MKRMVLRPIEPSEVGELFKRVHALRHTWLGMLVKNKGNLKKEVAVRCFAVPSLRRNTHLPDAG
jgi:hypothetical protein